jgi:hypothetical protein
MAFPPRVPVGVSFGDVTYQWPIFVTDSVVQEAFDIALDYLEGSGQAYPYSETQHICTKIIFDEWNEGKRHRVWLANKAIVAVENKHRPIEAAASITVLGSTRRP